MSDKYKLKVDKTTCEEIIKSQIHLLRNLQDIHLIKDSFNEININMREIFNSNEVLYRIKSKELYIENEYSKSKTNQSIIDAKEKVIEYLEEILDEISSEPSILNYEISQEAATIIIKRILNNFYTHIEMMYLQPTHRSAGITKEKLDNIKIINEYDIHSTY